MNWPDDLQVIENEFIPWAPWHTPPDRAKVALVATAGVFLKKGLHQPFGTDDPSFREFPSLVADEDLDVASEGYDQKYAREDLNVVFPLERLHQLAMTGYLGVVAPFAYSFSGPIRNATPLLANYAPSLAYRMKRMGADVALVVAHGPVDHQTATLVARAIELAGIPTVLFGTNREVLQKVGAPRAVVVKHPAGAPLGNPGNAGKHQLLLREIFDSAWEFEGPGLCKELAYDWSGS